MNIPFSGRAHHYTPAEEAAILDAVRNADPLTQGRYRDAFEKKFREQFGLPHAFTTCNATGALHMAAQLCLFNKGDEVIAPSHTFTASVYPFLKEGATPVWADIDPVTHVVSADTIAARITPRTKAIIVVHLYGYVADMPAIMALARKHKLLVIEDAAQAIGCKVEGKYAGAFGDFGIFSLHSHKNITTLGEGGILAVHDERYAKLIPMLRHNGHTAYVGERPDYWVPAMGNVDLPELDGRALMPNNYCLGEVECAAGIPLLDRLNRINGQKRERALHFINALGDYAELEFHKVDTDRHNYHLLIARVTNDWRDEIMRRLSRDKGIKCVVQYMPLDRYDLYRKLGFGTADCPNADRLYDHMISFPFQHWLSHAELEYMIASVKAVLQDLRAHA